MLLRVKWLRIDAVFASVLSMSSRSGRIETKCDLFDVLCPLQPLPHSWLRSSACTTLANRSLATVSESWRRSGTDTRPLRPRTRDRAAAREPSQRTQKALEASQDAHLPHKITRRGLERLA